MENKFDLLLTLASQNAGQPELDLYENAGDEFEPSKKFKKRMERLIKKAESRDRQKRYAPALAQLKRIAVAVLLVCTVCLGCILCIKAVREAILEAIVGWHEEYIVIDFSQTTEAEETVDQSYTIGEYKEPTAWLDGFERYVCEKNSNVLFIEYENFETQTLIVYSQSAVGSGKLYMSNNDTVVSTVQLGDTDAILNEYEVSNGTKFAALVWNDGVYQYVLEGNTPPEHLIKVAMSIE